MGLRVHVVFWEEWEGAWESVETKLSCLDPSRKEIGHFVMSLRLKVVFGGFCHQIKIIFSNQNNLEQHSIALIFEIRDTKLFKIKRFIKINPSLLLKTKRVQFSLLGKVSLTRKRRTAIHFEQHLLTELHVFQNS